MSLVERLKTILAENQIMVVLLALILGLLIPGPLRPINAFSTQLLISVFFFSSLRLSLGELIDYAKDWKMLAIANLFMLVVIPFALYYPFLPFSPDWALVLLILGAMPTGMTIALVADFFGGKTSLALLVTTTTSLLAPLTIPIIFKIAVGQAVPIPVLQMCWSLFLTIVVPFVLAMLVKRAIPKFVSRHDNAWRQISVAAFGILIAGIVADTSGDTLIALSVRDILIVGLGMLWLGAITFACYELLPWRTASERITIALCLIYLNNTLALFIGDKFFKNQNVIPKLLLLLLVVNVLLPPIKFAASHLTHPGIKNKNPLT
jgi:predicted Na+-dependent transporter